MTHAARMPINTSAMIICDRSRSRGESGCWRVWITIRPRVITRLNSLKKSRSMARCCICPVDLSRRKKRAIRVFGVNHFQSSSPMNFWQIIRWGFLGLFTWGFWYELLVKLGAMTPVNSKDEPASWWVIIFWGVCLTVTWARWLYNRTWTPQRFKRAMERAIRFLLFVRD